MRSQRHVSCAVGPAAGPELGVLAARVERIAAEPNGEHLERQIAVRVGSFGVTSLLDQIEDLRGARAMVFQVSSRSGSSTGSPAGRVAKSGAHRRSANERAHALERVDGGRAQAQAPLAERDAARLVERRRDRAREARRPRVGLFVVVLRGEPHQVLEAELEIERIALGAVDDVGHAR